MAVLEVLQLMMGLAELAVQAIQQQEVEGPVALVVQALMVQMGHPEVMVL
jgi:hypothetical protein